MCPGSPDRGCNACVEGPSVVTEVDGLLCPSVSQAYIVAKTTFLLKRWIQMMLYKGSSQKSLQGQWTFESLPPPPPPSPHHTGGPLRNPNESSVFSFSTIFPPVISVLWA